jgi:hypothetical protein
MGASVFVVRDSTEPVTPYRPDDMIEQARELLVAHSKNATNLRALPPDKLNLLFGQRLMELAEFLFYRCSEIIERGNRIRNNFVPDITVTLYIDATPGSGRGRLTDGQREHLLCRRQLHEDGNAGPRNAAPLRLQNGRGRLRHRSRSGRRYRARLHAADRPRPGQVRRFQHDARGDSRQSLRRRAQPRGQSRIRRPGRLHRALLHEQPRRLPALAGRRLRRHAEFDGKSYGSIFREYADCVAQGLVKAYAGSTVIAGANNGPPAGRPSKPVRRSRRCAGGLGGTPRHRAHGRVGVTLAKKFIFLSRRFSLLFRKKLDKFIPCARGGALAGKPYVMSKPLELKISCPGTHLGHYVITDKIAQGGMGTVFKALEPALERYVAIKVLRPEYAANPTYVQYFQEEARAVAALRHPNIIPIFYIGQEGNVVFFSMSYIEGETFENWIEGKRWFTEEQAKWFLSHAVAALHSAHKANIVHLDIKPANFLVDRANNIMLTDFGLAQKIVKDARGSGEREAFGTPAYVSPEQIPRGPTDQRTDIYSLGATLFHLMTGKQPFNGATVEDIIWGHLEKPFPIEIAREANVPTGWIYLIKK